MPHQSRVTLSLADAQDRLSIYALRYQVYVHELGQHPENGDGRLTDVLDDVNTYLVAKRDQVVVGFVSITPPNPHGYSIDKYFERRELPFVFDHGLYEVRLLTVVESDRRTMLATLLMYGALRYLESRSARTMVAIGRQQVLGLYQRAGLRSHGRRAKAGAVTYELMSADVQDVRGQVKDILWADSTHRAVGGLACHGRAVSPGGRVCPRWRILGGHWRFVRDIGASRPRHQR